MSTVAWKDVPTRTVDVGGVEFVHLVLDSLGGDNFERAHSASCGAAAKAIGISGPSDPRSRTRSTRA